MNCEQALSRGPQMDTSHRLGHLTGFPSAQVRGAPSVNSHSHIHAQTVQMKEKFTAPFMVYDAQARRIVANPQHNRALITEVHRLQSILLTNLRTPMEAHLSYTPKELLYEMEAALYHVCASLAVREDTLVLRHFLTDSEADPFMPQLESFLAHHNAPAKAVVALAHCLSEGTSHELLSSFLCMLEKRIQQELDPVVHRKRTEEERAALRATENNLRDVAQLVRDMQTAYYSIDTASQQQRRQPQSDVNEVDRARTPAANAISAKIVEEDFYRILRWVVAVDADRRALRAAASGTAGSTAEQRSQPTTAVCAPHSTLSHAQAKSFAKVTEYDAFSGQLTLERAGAAQRWGLLVNAKGLLVGLENEVRNSSEAAERLYDAVQQQSGEAGGLTIYEVNRRRIRPAHGSDNGVSTDDGDVMQKLRSSLTQNNRTLHLIIEKRKQVDLTVPREVLFEISHQGGEGGVGQRCILMMERASKNISWGLKVKCLEGSAAVLSDFAPGVQLSNAAKNLLFDMRGRLRVQKVNNRDMANLSMAEMRHLITSSLLLTLHLQVTDAKVGSQLEATASKSPRKEQPFSAEVVAPPQETPPLERSAPEAPREAVTSTEADVAADEGAGLMEEVDSEQVKISDVPASIADDFLKQQSPSDAVGADAVGAVVVPDVAEVDVPEVDTFEEHHWAKPTTTIGAPGDEPDVDAAKNAEGAESNDVTGDDFARRTLLECFQSVVDGKHLPSAEEVDVSTGGEEQNTSERGTAVDTDAADPDAVDGIEPGGGGAKTKSLKKTRGSVKKSSKTEDTLSRKNKKGTRGRRKKDTALLEEGENEADLLPKAVREEQENFGEVAGGHDSAAIPIGDTTTKEEAEAFLRKGSPINAAVEDTDAIPEKGKEATQTHGGKRSGQANTSAAAAAAAATVIHGEQENLSAVEEEQTDLKDTHSAPVDVQLVDLPPTAAEVAMDHARQSAKKMRGQPVRATASAIEAGEEGGGGDVGHDDALKEMDRTATEKEASPPTGDDADDAPRASLSELLKAEPLTFENDVRLEMFDGSTLQLERPSAKLPWNIKVAFAGDDIIMTKLPPFSESKLGHPFLRSLRASPQGEVKWVVDGLNGQDLSMMKKSSKTKVLETIKGSTKLSFALRVLRR